MVNQYKILQFLKKESLYFSETPVTLEVDATKLHSDLK